MAYEIERAFFFLYYLVVLLAYYTQFKRWWTLLKDEEMWTCGKYFKKMMMKNSSRPRTLLLKCPYSKENPPFLPLYIQKKTSKWRLKSPAIYILRKVYLLMVRASKQKMFEILHAAAAAPSPPTLPPSYLPPPHLHPLWHNIQKHDKLTLVLFLLFSRAIGSSHALTSSPLYPLTSQKL